ncbi:unnamed protein product [Darwinula stevensoni]|uniref:Calcium uniporter protein n=1 Tax=Darwinula stevensoni TaxID=69355 RepID=A0A7R8X3Z1_9CRUS|nr:unnamed protein product [Darwinula stevensoni]CAG0882879.1 unnamed protein product [Darwinula stevensoni]
MEVTVDYYRGLPVIEVPLPSRHERCRFTLRPISNTVGDFLEMLKVEDKGIDRVAAYTPDGVKIASSTTIEALMESHFLLVVNDMQHQVHTPEKERLTQEQMLSLSDVRNLVSQLYESLHVEQHQLQKERLLLGELEELQTQLRPLEDAHAELLRRAEIRTSIFTWMGLGYMAIQFGVLARLTWWEYSWDIMEPVTYFVTYATAMAGYAYFLLTRQECIYPDARDRQFLKIFHKKANKSGWDVQRYNDLCNSIHEVQQELFRIRDPMHLHIPAHQLHGSLPENFPKHAMSKTRLKLLQILKDPLASSSSPQSES